MRNEWGMICIILFISDYFIIFPEISWDLELIFVILAIVLLKGVMFVFLNSSRLIQVYLVLGFLK
jgi:cytochrome c oxidase subunit IV